jgi:hypothetical protein
VRGGGTADRVKTLEVGAASGFANIGRRAMGMSARGLGMTEAGALLLLDSEACSGWRNSGGHWPGMLSAVAWRRTIHSHEAWRRGGVAAGNWARGTAHIVM